MLVNPIVCMCGKATEQFRGREAASVAVLVSVCLCGLCGWWNDDCHLYSMMLRETHAKGHKKSPIHIRAHTVSSHELVFQELVFPTGPRAAS